MGAKIFFVNRIMKIEVYHGKYAEKHREKIKKTKIVAKQGCTALKSENGPCRPVGWVGAGFLVSGDLNIMP